MSVEITIENEGAIEVTVTTEGPTGSSDVPVEGTIIQNSINAVSGGAVYSALALKVDKSGAKQLSTEDYTTAEKTKLAGVSSGATANSTDAFLRARSNHTGLQDMDTIQGLQTALDDKVSNVSGKGLSTNDYTTAEKTKLSGIATGATANSSDATLLARANHTGTQLASTISDFQAQVSANTDVAAMKAIIGDGVTDGDTVVDTLKEMLTTFQTYEEGVDIATQLAGKVNVDGSKVLSDVNFTTDKDAKLSGIANGATANATDAQLRDRATHTGVQAISTITGLQDALDDIEPAARLEVNSRAVGLGDSIVQAEFDSAGTTTSFTSRGFIAWAKALSGNGFYMPVGGNLGVSGNSTAQILARVDTALALSPDLAFVEGGTNDCNSGTAATTIIGNLYQIYRALTAKNCKVIALTIPPRYGVNALSGPNETIRQTVNTWILTQESENIKVANVESVLGSSAFFYDGLHPNTDGAYAMGQVVATRLLEWLSDSRIADVLHTDTTYTTNGRMTGTGGSLNTATGSVASSWALLANNAGGATVVGSKTSSDNLTQQVITLSGTYTGSSKMVILYQDHDATLPVVGDTIESFADIEVTATLTNVVGVYLWITVYTAGYGSTLANIYALFPLDTTNFPVQAGTRFTVRTPPVQIAGGTPGILTHQVTLQLKDVGGSTAVSGAIKIHNVGTRKAEIVEVFTSVEKAQLATNTTNIATNTSAIAALSSGGDITLAALAALGSPIKAQSVGINFFECNTAGAMADGNCRFQALYLPTAATITGVAFRLHTAGNFTADNENAIGLYTYSAGVLTKVAQTANSDAFWKGTAQMTQVALSSTYAASAGLYFLILIYNSSAQTTAPAIGVGVTLTSTSQSTLFASNSGKLTGNIIGTNNTLPTSVTLSTVQTGNTPFWVGLY